MNNQATGATTAPVVIVTEDDRKVDYEDIRKNLTELSRLWISLRSIISKEISLHGTVSKFAEQTKVGHGSINRFWKNENTLTNSEMLSNLERYCSSRYPELSDLLFGILLRVEKLNPIVRALSLFPAHVIDLWIEGKANMQKFNISSKLAGAQVPGYSKTLSRFWMDKIALVPIREVQKEFEFIAPAVKQIDWGKIKTRKKSDKPKKVQGNKPPTPKGLTLHEQFRNVVDQCLAIYGTKEKVITACKENGIRIGLRTLQKGYSQGLIGKIGKSFMKSAQSKLLKQDSQTTFQPKTSQSPLADTQPRADQSIGVAIDSNFFGSILGSSVDTTLSIITKAIELKEEDRVKLIKDHPEINQLLGAIQALNAHDPQGVLTMISGVSQAQPLQQSTRNVAKPTRVRRGSRGSRR